MTWEEYCTSKKIDSIQFKKNEPQKWHELKTVFEQVHPKSFTEQKKFLLNDLRRKYLSNLPAEKTGAEKMIKPVIKPVKPVSKTS
jgi:hypothetical protein